MPGCSEAKQYVRVKYNKPGRAYLGIVSRLDAPVSGVVLMARTSKAAGRLAKQFRSRTVEKIYWVVIQGEIHPASGNCMDYVRKNDRHRRMHIADPDCTGASLARLSYQKLRSLSDATLLEVSLETGRKHQIRLQFSHRGHPILGDRKYGSRRPFPVGIALHAHRLVVVHPVGTERIKLTAPLPEAWRRFGIAP